MERSFASQAHVRWYCRYHVVIVPKYRKKVLFGQSRIEIGKILRELAKQKKTDIIEGHALPDHIHLVLSIPPKYSVAHVVGFLKGKSAIRAHNLFTRKRALIHKTFWSRGYFVSSVGLDEEQIKKYVQEQGKHDQFFDGPHMDLRWE